MINSSRKVTIVEDDILLLLILERLVQKFGYEVSGTAYTGEGAYRMIQLHKPDIILMDINLEDEIKGTEVVEMIRKDGSETPVIFISGEKKPAEILKINLLGSTDFLLKPIESEVLSQALQKARTFKEHEGLYTP
ncbi:MAG: response regulator [Balneolaceae bacterium]